MSRMISTTVYTLEELSESAREQARVWYREHALNDDWYQNVFDEFCGTCNILGVEINMYRIPRLSGGSRQHRCLWFSGFCHQGDGACFEGDYVISRRPPTGSGNTTLKTQTFTGLPIYCKPFSCTTAVSFMPRSAITASISMKTVWQSRSNATALPGRT